MRDMEMKGLADTAIAYGRSDGSKHAVLETKKGDGGNMEGALINYYSGYTDAMPKGGHSPEAEHRTLGNLGNFDGGRKS